MAYLLKEEVSIEARPEVPDHSLPALALAKYVWFETARSRPLAIRMNGQRNT